MHTIIQYMLIQIRTSCRLAAVVVGKKTKTKTVDQVFLAIHHLYSKSSGIFKF